MKEPDIKNIIEHLERILNNIRERWDTSEKLLETLKNPLLVDDRALAGRIHWLNERMLHLENVILKFDLGTTYGEIRYIGNRLNEIEKLLFKMQKEGIKQNVELEFKIDGYNISKAEKQINRLGSKDIKPNLTDDDDNNIKALLSELTERERNAIIHRIGLFGNDKCTFTKLGKILKLSSSRAAYWYRRSLRKLTHPTRENRLKEIKNINLINAVQAFLMRIGRTSIIFACME